jgi:hypothetical protein
MKVAAMLLALLLVYLPGATFCGFNGDASIIQWLSKFQRLQGQKLWR